MGSAPRGKGFRAPCPLRIRNRPSVRALPLRGSPCADLSSGLNLSRPEAKDTIKPKEVSLVDSGERRGGGNEGEWTGKCPARIFDSGCKEPQKKEEKASSMSLLPLEMAVK